MGVGRGPDFLILTPDFDDSGGLDVAKMIPGVAVKALDVAKMALGFVVVVSAADD